MSPSQRLILWPARLSRLWIHIPLQIQAARPVSRSDVTPRPLAPFLLALHSSSPSKLKLEPALLLVEIDLQPAVYVSLCSRSWTRLCLAAC